MTEQMVDIKYESSPVLECGLLKLNITEQLVSVNGERTKLTTSESKVLEYLVLHAGELVTKTELAEHIYGQDLRASNVIEVFVGRLRKKLDPSGELIPIETVYGRGYRLAFAEYEE